MQRTWRLTGVTTLALGLLTTTPAAPAQAERPEVTRAECAAVAGAYEQERGNRTCTTTTVATQTGPVVSASAIEVLPRCTYHRSCVADLVEHTFTGTSRRIDTVTTVTVRTQRGGGPVTTSSSQVVGSTLEPLSCSATPDLDASRGPLTLDACAARGLFVA